MSILLYNLPMKQELLNRLTKIEEALNKSLCKEVSKKWQDSSFGKLSEAITENFIQNLITPNKNLIDLGGKRWRPLLLILCYELQSRQKGKNALSEETAYSLTPLVEFVHTASLIHDDIEDSADLRRGKPTAHITYGLDTALNAASWLYFEAPVCINSTDFAIPDDHRLTLYKLYTEELRRLHLGQAMDIFWHRTPSLFPTKDEYQGMVRCKTGTLASMAAKIGYIAGGATEEEADKAGETAANIGMGFQIIDDVINLTSGNPGKKRGDDIVEGKKSLPVLIHVEKHPDDAEKIAKLMKQASEERIDSPVVEECIKLLESSGCIKDAAEEGKKLIKDNLDFFNSDLISELFTSMIPENFR